MTSAHPSIAVVGGGIAGLYCAYKLAQEGFPVTVLEQLAELGGRVETVEIGGIACECGPMRFELAIQPLLAALAQELGITFTPFAPPKAEPVHTTRYTLEPNEWSAAQLAAIPSKDRSRPDQQHSEHTTSLDLLRLGIFRIMHCADAAPGQPGSTNTAPWDFADVIERRGSDGQNAIQRFADSLTDAAYDRIRTTKVLAGRPLYRMGLWNALDYVLSAGAVAKIRDIGTFYHLLPENPSAAEWGIFWLRLFRTTHDLSTINGPGGVGQLVTRLVDRIRKLPLNNVQLLRQAAVVGVQPADVASKIRLTVDFRELGRGIDLEFDHVILALPKQPLSLLTQMFPPDVRACIDGVNGFPLLKTAAVIRHPWWKGTGGGTPAAQHGAHLVPTREVHYAEHPQDDAGMILLYTDRPANAYWTPYVQLPHTGAQLNRPDDLKRDLAAQLVALKLHREIGSHEDYRQEIDDMAGSMIGFVIRDWSKPPFGAASHAWQPGVNVPQAREALKAFSLIGRPGTNNVHICGEAYSDYQGFIEGSLRSAEAAIEAIKTSASPAS